MTRLEWPLRLIPRRSPPFWTGLAISVGAVGLSMILRGAMLGWGTATGFSSTLFPALIVATLYAGPRWGWGALAAATLIALLSPRNFPVGLSGTWIVIQIVVSQGVTVAVCGALREALLRLDEANAAQAAAQRELEVTETRFRTLADSAPIMMWVSRRPGGGREFVNRAYLDFHGTTFEEALTLDWRKVLHPDDLDRILAEQVAGEASRASFVLEARYRRADGEYRWVRSVSQPRLADGQVVGFIGVGVDVTDSKQVQQDLERINDLLNERVDLALAERDQAEAQLHRAQRLEAVGQMTGGVAHDFNNLLTVVIGALDLMQRHPKDEARRERMIEAAMGAARRGERLTQQLLAFSRRQALKPQPTRIDDLIVESEPLLHRAVGESVRLAIVPGAADLVVNVDPSQLEAALMNLVVNARDATPPGGMIRVETLPVRLKAGEIEDLGDGDFLCIAVHDTGEGMDAATLARVFEPFFTTKEPGKGTGLGLSQAYGFARQSGGVATVDSAPGKGSSVCLYLPLVAASASPDADAAGPPADHFGGLRVLLAEDDAQVAELVEALLRDLGHEVVRTAEADSALRILRAGTPVDLLLTDLIMPGDRTGVDLAREAVAMRPGLPVILSSGYTGEALSAAEDAPWPLLRKPYGADALAAAISDVLKARQAA